jgi:hypothetical protein
MSSPTFRVKYGSAANRYVNFVNDSIVQYWHIDVYGTKIPSLAKDLGGWGTDLTWSGKTGLLGEIATSLYVATKSAPTARTPIYLDVATRVAAGFKRRLQPNRTGWIWDVGLHTESGNYAKLPDTAHASEAMLMILAYEAGIVFSLGDVQRMANTLSDIIWNGSISNPMFSNYIDGSNLQYRTRTQPGENGLVYSAWALTGKYSVNVQTAISSLLQAIIAGKQNPSIAYNATSYGKVALSGHLLRNSTEGTIAPPQSLAAPVNLKVAP